jgi:hypothetical protein
MARMPSGAVASVLEKAGKKKTTFLIFIRFMRTSRVLETAVLRRDASHAGQALERQHPKFTLKLQRRLS